MDDFEARRGRPRTGRNPRVQMTLPRALLDRIDAAADSEFTEQRDMIVRLLEIGLEKFEDDH